MEGIRSILPYLLRFPKALSKEDIAFVNRAYATIGKEAVDIVLKKEKQSRPFAAEVLSKCGCDVDYWNLVHDEYVKRNTVIVEILESVFNSFHEKGGKTLNVYENFGAVLSSGLSIGNFASGDVDLTVEENELPLAIEALHEHGFYEDERIDHAKASDIIILPFFNPSILDGKGYWLNIMRKPIARSFMLKQDKYLARLTGARIKGLEKYQDTEIRLLEPTAMVYFNALHFACEHFYSASPGMVLCCDLDRVIRTRKIDWDRIAQWSHEDNAGVRIRLSLDICHYFLQTEVPLEIFGEPSKYYLKLRNRIVDEKHDYLISQDGKINRLTTELLSDDIPLFISLLRRLWS